jgi:hypothetical protein
MRVARYGVVVCPTSMPYPESVSINNGGSKEAPKLTIKQIRTAKTKLYLASQLRPWMLSDTSTIGGAYTVDGKMHYCQYSDSRIALRGRD